MREVSMLAAIPNELIARFENDFIKEFWDSLSPDQLITLKDTYYEINRALSNAIEKNIKCIGQEYCISLDTIRAMKNDEMHKHYALDHISRSIAAELLKNDDMGIEIFDDWSDRTRKYRFHVPFITLKKT